MDRIMQQTSAVQERIAREGFNGPSLGTDALRAELAEVWCSECDQPATGTDAKCDLHRSLASTTKPISLNSWERLVLRTVLQVSAERNEETADGASPEDSPVVAKARARCAELAVEYRKLVIKFRD